MSKGEKRRFFTKGEWAITAVVLAAILVGALFLLPPLHQSSYAPVGNMDIAAETGPIDINHATAEKLALLPGIGEVKSKAILEYRQENGPFETLEDLANVKGISQKTIDSWQGLAVVH